jgi:secreted trypsin-like serine protease
MRSGSHSPRHPALRRTLAGLATAVAALLASTLPAAAVHDGRRASTDVQPFVVAITDEAGTQFCGGTLVTPTKVVTAGHCVANREAAGLRVVGGRTDLRTSEGEVRRVTDVWLHPRYDFLTYDAAVLTLARALPYRTLPLAGPDDDALYANGRTATIFGWGRTTPDSGTSPVLRRAALVLAPLPACDPYTFEGDKGWLKVCGLPPAGTKASVCSGDSGGPLVVSGRLVGIVSTGNKYCEDAGALSVFTRVNKLGALHKAVADG